MNIQNDSKNQLKKEFSILMHEIFIKNRKIVEHGEYDNLLNLCEQDITILSYVKTKEEITAKEISLLLSVPKTTIVSAVSRLESRGYIRKIENVNDRRQKFLELTDKGVQANKEHEEFENIFLDSLVSLWDDLEKEKLVKLLQCRKELV